MKSDHMVKGRMTRAGKNGAPDSALSEAEITARPVLSEQTARNHRIITLHRLSTNGIPLAGYSCEV
jgi:hypothetical protein